jgi:hypothetical protein
MSTTTQEAVEMTSTVAKSGAIRTPATTAAPRSRGALQRALTLAGIILMLAMASLGTWLAIDRMAGSDANTASASTSVPAWAPTASTWPGGLEVIQLKKQLVRAGYSIKVNGNLDPVTKSALADFLQLDSAHPLSPSLADELEGTVITGRRDAHTWNGRFGLDRVTRFVERPLTGPGGQLDDNGNLRVP